MSYCDLHMHSRHSDGTCTPRELVEHARRQNLAAIALTDHDTFNGVAEAQDAGREMGVRVLSGVEISVEYASKTVHMLGYCFDSGVETLRAGLDQLVHGRHVRNQRIIERLNDLGIPITYEQVLEEAGEKVVGRPHFAMVMLHNGWVQTKQEAFDKYLSRGAAAYEERLRFSPADSVALIREAGGIAVLAHPKFVALHKQETLEEVVRPLVDAGLQGIECHYSLHSDEETAEYIALARRFGLVVTGGSDFHGDIKPEVHLGTGLGDLRVPIECADALMELANSRG